MRSDVPAMLAAAAGLLICFNSEAEAAACSPRTVNMDVAKTSDLQSLADAMDCTGKGYYNVTWHGKIEMDHTIEVFGEKTVTVTGSGTTTNDIHDTLYAGGIRIIFSVSDGSTLKLNRLVLDGGSEEEGGAVAVRESSCLHVSNCIFVNNAALAGGENIPAATRYRPTK